MARIYLKTFLILLTVLLDVEAGTELNQDVLQQLPVDGSNAHIVQSPASTSVNRSTSVLSNNTSGALERYKNTIRSAQQLSTDLVPFEVENKYSSAEYSGDGAVPKRQNHNIVTYPQQTNSFDQTAKPASKTVEVPYLMERGEMAQFLSMIDFTKYSEDEQLDIADRINQAVKRREKSPLSETYNLTYREFRGRSTHYPPWHYDSATRFNVPLRTRLYRSPLISVLNSRN